MVRKGISQKFLVKPNFREERGRAFQGVTTVGAVVILGYTQLENQCRGSGEHYSVLSVKVSLHETCPPGALRFLGPWVVVAAGQT